VRLVELVFPVVEGLAGDALGATEGGDGEIRVGEAPKAFGPELACLGAGADGLFGQGHDDTPEDRATPPKIIPCQ